MLCAAAGWLCENQLTLLSVLSSLAVPLSEEGEFWQLLFPLLYLLV